MGSGRGNLLNDWYIEKMIEPNSSKINIAISSSVTYFQKTSIQWELRNNHPGVIAYAGAGRAFIAARDESFA